MTEATTKPWAVIQDEFGNEFIVDSMGDYVVEMAEQTIDTHEIVKAVNSHEATVAALEAVEWAVPTPHADNDGSCPSCYAGKPVKFHVIPTVFERKNHMKVCQLADALEAAK